MKKIRKAAVTIFTLLTIGFNLIAQIDSIDYLGQEPPGKTQTIFNLSVSAGYSAIERIAFSADGKEIYYGELIVDANYTAVSSARIKYYTYEDNIWKGPFILFENYYSPYITNSGDTMFFQNSSPKGLWYAVKTDTGWSAPSKFMSSLDVIGNSGFEGNLQQTNTGTYYLTTSKAEGGLGGTDVAKINITDNDTTIESLSYPINNSGNNNYLYIAKNESYAITYTLLGGTHQEGRALISYPKQDGTWTNPKSMGFGGWAVTLSPDNKYLFHSSYSGSRFDTYWIKVDSLINNLKLTNFIPYVRNKIVNQSITTGQSFNYTIPDSIFVDDDGNNTLTYSATLINNNPLPSWLSFNPVTMTFSGTSIEEDNYSIKVTATDTANASIYTSFSLIVEGSSSINQNVDQNTRVFPNPSNGSVTISFGERHYKNASIEITNLEGKQIFLKTIIGNSDERIDLTGKPKGIYIAKLVIDCETIIRKIYKE